MASYQCDRRRCKRTVGLVPPTPTTSRLANTASVWSYSGGQWARQLRVPLLYLHPLKCLYLILSQDAVKGESNFQIQQPLIRLLTSSLLRFYFKIISRGDVTTNLYFAGAPCAAACQVQEKRKGKLAEVMPLTMGWRCQPPCFNASDR